MLRQAAGNVFSRIFVYRSQAHIQNIIFEQAVIECTFGLKFRHRRITQFQIGIIARIAVKFLDAVSHHGVDNFKILAFELGRSFLRRPDNVLREFYPGRNIVRIFRFAPAQHNPSVYINRNPAVVIGNPDAFVKFVQPLQSRHGNFVQTDGFQIFVLYGLINFGQGQPVIGLCRKRQRKA